MYIGFIAKAGVVFTDHNYYILPFVPMLALLAGYGFDKYSTDLQSGDGKTKNAILTDYISSTKPFYFSVKLPDGNYDVKVILGDPLGTAAATIRAECRRLMITHAATGKGKFATLNFTVHVKDSLIRNEKNEVVARLGRAVERLSEVENLRGKPDQWLDGQFVHPHDACFTPNGDIFVAEWVATGRVTKLERVS